MVVQTERIWLFETILSDPFIFEKTDGIDITMSPNDDRLIELLDIDTAVFYIDTVLKGGLGREVGYGGEDHLPISSNGKTSASYDLDFNIPLDSDTLIEQLLGKEYSIVGMRRDLSMFACFARFVAKPLKIDNEVLQRMTLETDDGNHILFELNSLNVTEVINVIGNPPPIYPPPFEEVLAFDYPIESAMN